MREEWAAGASKEEEGAMEGQPARSEGRGGTGGWARSARPSTWLLPSRPAGWLAGPFEFAGHHAAAAQACGYATIT